ncbi:MAG: heavy metal translocating P-type ATPase metal-binding domain-containing protein [Methylococcales bacterium]|nr:heavy metal translocating P-type ATPase metal-binding domain-containing protein [Methylococcales bacterium]
MTGQKTPCILCQQPVLLRKFTLTTETGKYYFCCEGCKNIYQLLNSEQHFSTHKSNQGTT